MVGITLSPEQLQQAPPEVRRWIEQQIAAALGLSRPAPAVDAPPPHLVACDLEQVRGILSLIRDMLPVAGVFFELAREPIAVTQRGLHVLRMEEMQRHARLQGLNEVVACLGAIDEALRRVSGASDVALTVLDGSGHCLVAEETSQSILALWREIVASHHAVRPAGPITAASESGTAPVFQTPYGISLPASAVGGAQRDVAPA